MGNLLIKYKIYIKILILLLAFIGLYFAKGFGSYCNKQVEKLFSLIGGEKRPDTNIVIVHITEDDIQKFGAWPLKRSYYALLINQLTQLNVKRIGLEVFLSQRITAQSKHNELLKSEIEKSGKVILASIVEDYNESTMEGKILFPEPKFEIKSLTTGHLDFIDNGGILIPLNVKQDNNIEPSFSLALSGLQDNYKNVSKIKVNFLAGWEKFKNYSLLEFFEWFEAKNPELNLFNNKIVLIGVSDELIARNVPSAFEDRVPGVGLHAFALDNLINHRYIKTNLFSFSAFLIVILLSIFVFIETKGKLIYQYLILGFGFLFISFVLFYSFYYEIHYTLFLFPFILLAITEIMASLIKGKAYIEGIINESEILRTALGKKEAQLLRLQKELDVSGEKAPHELVEKVTQLKSLVENLKIQQADELTASLFTRENKAEKFWGMVYRSKQMENVIKMIERVAPENATVLLLGESGTGKELAAKAIHQLSKRKENNFIAFNCGALSESLLESELFGHVKGAFTNAMIDKQGRFEMADRGTIFLDEIGETTENFQVKLLRILQNGEFERVGSSVTMKTDVRVIAATNKNPDQLVKEKKFREDLFYRLNVIRIELPALRDRKEDIEVLTQHFLSLEQNDLLLSKAVLDQMVAYNWKGNVRELESIIKRAVILARSENRNIIKLKDLPEVIVSKANLNFEELILDSLREKQFSHSSVNETAKELEISRTIVSENLRGLALKAFYSSEFNIEKANEIIYPNAEQQEKEKVKSKIETFLYNIEKDVNLLKPISFEEVKKKLSSKYKNLPQKFHFYLDEIIKEYLK